MDPNSDGLLEFNSQFSSFPFRTKLLLYLSLALRNDWGRLHSRCYSLPVLLLQEQGTPSPPFLLLGLLPIVTNHLCFSSLRDSSTSRPQQYGRLAMALCTRRNVDRSDWYRILVLSPAVSHTNKIQIPRQGWLVRWTRGEDHGQPHPTRWSFQGRHA